MRKVLTIVLCQLALSLPAFAGEGDIRMAAPQAHPTDLLITTTDSLDGYRIADYKGMVRGISVRQPTVGESLSANLERMKGGHIGAYTSMCEQARQQAYDMCLDKARELGANAIVGLKYDSTAFEHGDNVDIEVICYGTAVTIQQSPAR